MLQRLQIIQGARKVFCLIPGGDGAIEGKPESIANCPQQPNYAQDKQTLVRAAILLCHCDFSIFRRAAFRLQAGGSGRSKNYFRKVLAKIPICLLRLLSVKKQAEIAQLVEQWTENPRVRSSNLRLGIAKPSQS